MHILLECPNMEGIRRKYFSVDASLLRNVFESVDNQKSLILLKKLIFTTYCNVCYPVFIVAQ